MGKPLVIRLLAFSRFRSLGRTDKLLPRFLLTVECLPCNHLPVKIGELSRTPAGKFKFKFHNAKLGAWACVKSESITEPIPDVHKGRICCWSNFLGTWKPCHFRASARL